MPSGSLVHLLRFGNRGSTWRWCNGRLARELSMLAGHGLITFEVAEVAWIGFQPLDSVLAPVGATVLAFAAAGRQQRASSRSR